MTSYDGKKWFTVCRDICTQGQKNTLSLKEWPISYIYMYILYIFFEAVIVLLCNYFPKLLKTHLQIFAKQIKVFLIILENNCTLVQ